MQERSEKERWGGTLQQPEYIKVRKIVSIQMKEEGRERGKPMQKQKVQRRNSITLR